MSSMRKYAFQFNEIKLNDTENLGIEQVQLLRTGTFNHALFGKFDITKDTLKKLKENFDNGARRVDLAIDYFHESDKFGAGWIKDVELREEENELWIEVEWTDKAKERILNKEIRYLSADFDFNYKDSETGKAYGPTLFGGGLTNRPHVKDMRPILTEEQVNKIDKLILLFEKNNPNFKLEEALDFENLLNALEALSDDEKRQIMEKLVSLMPEDLENDLNEDDNINNQEEEMTPEEKTQFEEAHKAKLAEKDAEIKSLKRENKFNTLLSEGKAVEAQRDAYVSEDMDKFLEQSQEINLSESGTGKGTEEKKLEEEGKEKKLSDLTLEEANDKVDSLVSEKMKEDEELDFERASDLVLNENQELYKRIYG